MRFDVDVDGCGHGKEVVVLDDACLFVGQICVKSMTWSANALGWAGSVQVIVRSSRNCTPLCLSVNCRWWLNQSALFVDHVLKIESVMVPEHTPWSPKSPSSFSASWFIEFWMAVVCWYLFLYLPLRRRLHRAEVCVTQWLVVQSMRPASHCSLVDVLGGTARVMAALRRRRAV